MSKYNSSNEQNCPIGEYIRKAESDFTGGTTTFSKYVDFSLYEDINKIFAYLESKHTSGPTDSQGREKPFFNIVLAARNIWYRATDIDRKNIKLRATKSADDIGVFLATIHLQEWMRRENFGTFLNSWGINSAAFNESVLKFVEQDDRLIPSVISWNRIICDAIDFKNNPKIEILELTEAQLKARKGYDPEMVESLCTALTTRELTDKQKQDNKSNYIKLYEIHGVFPKSYITKNEKDEDDYVQQMHVLSFLATDKEDVYQDYTLYAGRESKDPYILAALIPEIDGSIALRGSVKTLFDAQWMQNHTVKAIKDQLDLASKMIFQTADATFVGQNVLTSLENGSILTHKTNMPLTQVANNFNNATALENFQQKWKQLGNEITGISESMLGVNPPSGTAWRQVDALLQESHSLFELMTENRGLSIEEIMREHVIPFLKKQMDTSDEIAATLEAHDIEKIDARFIKNSSIRKTNEIAKEKILNGENVTPEQQQQMTEKFAGEARSVLQSQGTQRFFKPSEIPDKTWKQLFDGLEWVPEVDVTNENVDKEAMSTLSTLFEKIASNPNILSDPNAKMIFNKILELTGAVSPLEIVELPPPSEKPMNKISESLSYKDVPEDIKRQMEAHAGFQPSKITNAPVASPAGTPPGAAPAA